MEKNDEIEVLANALGTNGEGIVKLGENTLFVPRLLPGEKARVKILKTKGNVLYGKIVELLVPAEDRVRAACPVFGRCGGCQIQHMRYRMQLKFKTERVRDALRKIGGIETEISHCERSDKEFAYRNKLQLPIGHKDGKNLLGFYAERSHRIVDTNVCPIHPEWAEKVIGTLRAFMEKCGLDGYDEEERTGQLRRLVVRELKGKFLITLVVTDFEIKGIDYLIYLLDEIFPVYSFYLNLNTEPTNGAFGKEFRLIKGKGVYSCTDGGIIFEAGANTFVQVNENVRGKLYERVLSQVEKGETVVDCYAGGGLLTAMLAKKCGKAYGIEIVPEASACADEVKVQNGLDGRMVNILGSVEEKLPQVLKEERVDCVVLDPPRAGADRSVLRAVIESGVKKLVYVSCDPATLARDLGILTGTLTESEGGELKKAAGSGAYEILSVQPFDMFPQTKHVETLVRLQRK